MEIDFIKSDINKIDKYVKLYQKCFTKYPLKNNKIYFEWLYKKNPLGNFIGIDAVDLNSGEEIGQVGGIPYEFNYNGRAETFYTYNNFKRTINFSFKVFLISNMFIFF